MDESLLSLCLATQAPVPPAALWKAWSLAPAVTLPLLAVSVAYFAGWRNDRGLSDRRQAWCFAMGMLALAVAVVSPLCRLAAELAWAHMIQHVLLVAIAPPLLLLGRPLSVAGRLAPWFTTVAGWLHKQFPNNVSGIVFSTVLYAVTIWFWHVPALYQAALLSGSVHLVVYLTLIGTSVWFWSGIIEGMRTRDGISGAGIAALFATLLQTGLLAVLLTLSPRPWYPLMSQHSADWGLSPLEDQQLAGLIMWVPMSFIYLGAALALAARWIGGAPERAANRNLLK